MRSVVVKGGSGAFLQVIRTATVLVTPGDSPGRGNDPSCSAHPGLRSYGTDDGPPPLFIQSESAPPSIHAA